MSFGSKSHGARAARLPTTSSQSPAALLAFQHHSARVSVLGLSHGSASRALCGGVPPNASQRAVYGFGGVLVSSVIVPEYVRGSAGGAPSPNSQTCTK